MANTPKLTVKRIEKYLSKTIEEDGCWLWQGSLNVDGYARTSYDNRVHRIMYFVAYGKVPPVLDHLCRRRNCIRPLHLEPVSTRENLLRGNTLAAKNAAKTHCKRGHKFTPENTHAHKNQRLCRKCSALKTMRYEQRKKYGYATV